MFKFNLQHFAAGDNVHTTSGIASNTSGNITAYDPNSGLSVEMKTYYSDYLIDMADPDLVHDQFGQKRPIPKGRGKTIEFRKFDPLPKALTPLTEGVTPNGNKIDAKAITAEVHQYGDYTELSDVLQLTAIDNCLVEATQLLGSQAGRTLDTVTREVLSGGTNVQYGEGQVQKRVDLVGGEESGNHYLTVAAIKNAVRTLKRFNAPKINGSYVCILHTDTAHDLTNDPMWKDIKIRDPKDLYKGEIGELFGVRFVETSEAKVFEEAGSNGRDVYSTLVMGANAYGVTGIEGGGLEHIVKQLGSAGTADPLNQRGTAGWKATKAAVRLVEPYLVRIETTASYETK